MKVDLRDRLKNKKEMKVLPKNHRNIFEQQLQKELHQESDKTYSFLKIAAAIVLLFGLGYFALMIDNPLTDGHETSNNEAGVKTPEFKKVEDFYLTAINYQIAKIKITDDNRDLLEVYLSQLSELQKEYDKLSLEFKNDKEVSEETIDAMIENLQLRLHLMRQLKRKLNKIENNKLGNNEKNQA